MTPRKGGFYGGRKLPITENLQLTVALTAKIGDACGLA
jgi:hypothetical protein